MASARIRRERSIDYWPGFVDALSTLVLGIIFLLTVFVVVQFFLSQEVAGKDTALIRLNAQISQLTDQLSLDKTDKVDMEDEIARLRASLSGAEGERDRLKTDADGAGAGASLAQAQLAESQGKLNTLNGALDNEKGISARALAQVEVLNQQIAALRRQLSTLEQALDAAEQKDRDTQTRIADLGQRLNVALAQRVQELSRYRSDFFGKLREILGNRPDIRVVGDRFVFQAEVFFDSAKPCSTPRAATSSTSSPARCSISTSRSRPTSPGCCAWTGTPTSGRSRARNSPRTGRCRRRAPSPSSSISSPRESRRSAWSPPASANSSRSIPTGPRRPIAAIGGLN